MALVTSGHGYHFWTRVPLIGLSFLSSWFHLCFVHLFRFSLFGLLYQQLFMFRTPKLLLQTMFIIVDALWKYLEYFCKPVTTCRTVGALKISAKIHVCSEALSQCLSLVYIFPSFSSFHIIAVPSTHLSLFALNIQAFFFFLRKNIECFKLI